MDRGRQLLHKFIDGGLTNEERFELEKIALDDDFVADAWEGVVSKDRSTVQVALQRLESRINKKDEAKVIPLTKWLWPVAVAASVVLLLSFFFLLRSGSTDELSIPTTAIVVEETEMSTPESTPLSTDNETDLASVELTKKNTDQPAASNDDLKVVTPATPIIEDRTTSIVAATDNAVPTLQERRQQEEETPIAVLQERLQPDSDKAETTIEEASEDDISSIAAATPPQADLAVQSLEEVGEEQIRKEKIPPSPLSLKARKSNESPVVSQALSRKVDDQTDFPQPKIGFKEYQEALKKQTTITREDLFMMGLKPNFEVRSRFKTNEEGIPNEVEILNVSDGTVKDKLVALLKAAGPWIHTGEEWTFYNFRVPVKE